MYSEDDIQYALEATEVVYAPDRRIDTFGNTSFQFHLISELMDRPQQVRVRSGKIQAERPRLLRPEPYNDLDFEGFGEQATAFSAWLKQRPGAATLLRYGFSFQKSDVVECLLHDRIADVSGRIIGETRDSGNPMTAVIHGVDDTWEICLLKFTIDMIEKSHKINVFDFKRRGLL